MTSAGISTPIVRRVTVVAFAFIHTISINNTCCHRAEGLVFPSLVDLHLHEVLSSRHALCVGLGTRGDSLQIVNFFPPQVLYVQDTFREQHSIKSNDTNPAITRLSSAGKQEYWEP